MVLVTGPTGSGKTNTLYSALQRVNVPETNIITAEDPVEFQLPGVNQVQMKDVDRPQLRGRPALVPAPGPQHHPGRRDPRLRDRRDRDQGGAHRPPRALDPAHQRRAVHDLPSDEHGHRAVPRRDLGQRDRGPAAGPEGLPELQGGGRDADPGAALGRLRRERGAQPQARQGARVREVRQHRVQGPRRPVRGDGHDRGHARARSCPAPRRSSCAARRSRRG